MAKYQVVISKSAGKEIEKLPRQIIPVVITSIRSLGDEPRPKNCKKLKSKSGLYRIRVGDYRVIYDVDDSILIVDVRKVGHRREVYN